VVAGILNTYNNFGSLKGSDSLVGKETTKKDYLTSFTFTALATVAAGAFGLVPYAPFVSSIGFLRQTEIYERMPLIIGSFIFFLMGVIQTVGVFFSTLALCIAMDVLLVDYLQVFIFFMMGVIHPVGVFFSTLPLSIGSAVLFVAYLQMFTSSIEFLKDITVNTMNVYRVAIPIFVGAIIMTFPASYFESLPAQLRP